jgi:2-oxoglutarate dehydrogenase E2 component (dihydrolipoamide succinyltransferase)
MKIEVKVPSVGESITSGVLSRWLVKSGDMVREGQTLFEMETDKVNVEVPAPASGRIEILVAEGEEVIIGRLVAYIDTDASGEQASGDTGGASETEKKKSEKSDNIRLVEKETARPEETGEQKTSPSVRKLAEEKQVDLGKIEGTGKDARITVDDVLAKTSGKEDKRETAVKMSQLRRAISKNLMQARQEAAHLTTFNEINMEHVIHIRAKHKDDFLKKYGIKLGFMSFFVKACCQALKEFPEVNTIVRGDEIVYRHYYNIGVAVAVDEGLIVPVIKNADTMSFARIELALAGLAEKARNRKISLDDLSSGTFTITNGGVFGSMLSTPIPSHPQTAILGMHAVTDRPCVIDGKVEIRPIMYAALTYDHRVIDGKDAVLFLVSIKKYIEDPESLLIEL